MEKTLKELKIGDKVKLGKIYGKPITWAVADHDHEGYPEGAVTVIAADIIKLAAFDAKEPDNKTGGRAEWGNNNYLNSNIRTWLNSRKEPGNWFEKAHGKDAPPIESNVSCNPYADHPGFLNDFTVWERDAILATQFFTVSPEVDGGERDWVEDHIFLLSAVEAGFSGDDTEGHPLALFTNDESRIARLTKEAAENSVFKHDLIRPGETWYWWLRTPYAAYSNSVRYVRSDGSLNHYFAYSGYRGLRPACNLSSSIPISELPDEDGAYVLFPVEGKESVLPADPEKVRIITIETVKSDLMALKTEYLKQGVHFTWKINLRNS